MHPNRLQEALGGVPPPGCLGLLGERSATAQGQKGSVAWQLLEPSGPHVLICQVTLISACKGSSEGSRRLEVRAKHQGNTEPEEKPQSTVYRHHQYGEHKELKERQGFGVVSTYLQTWHRCAPSTASAGTDVGVAPLTGGRRTRTEQGPVRTHSGPRRCRRACDPPQSGLCFRTTGVTQASGWRFDPTHLTYLCSPNSMT